MKRRKHYLILFILFVCAVVTQAQIVQLRTVDIGALWKAGKAHPNFVPAYSGDTLKPFDGNPFNALEMLNTDSLILTVQFDSAISIEKAKTYFWHNAEWFLESANSLTDLNSKLGTYSLLVPKKSANSFQWDSSAFAKKEVSLIRLSIKNPSDSTIRFGELVLEGSITFTKFIILPQPIQIIPNTSLQLQLKIQDEQGNFHSNFISSPILWESSNHSIATVDEFGKVSAFALGECEITVRTLDNKLKGFAPLMVVQDFRSTKVKPMTVKVALVIQDPWLPSSNRIHEEFGWRDPKQLSNKLVFHFKEATDSVVNFQFVEIIDANILFTRFYGNFLSVTQYVELLKEPGWKTLRAAEDSGQIWFDYREMVKYYHFDEKRNNNSIDEVWVFAAPFLGMYESQLMGPKAFWWNSPPIKDGTALNKLLSVMGLNYERGVDQAFHSFGHRVESALAYAYFEATGLNWNSTRTNPTPWDLFTRIEKDMPGEAHVGNVHFPPNGAHDYDYGNSTIVKSFAENWYRYPYLLDQSSQVNVATWLYTPGEPLAEGQDHLGFLRWWYGHIPRYEGVSNGVLNNWWHYVVDYEAAVALAKSTHPVGLREENSLNPPRKFGLEQNYPNPFNPSTVINYSLENPSHVSVKIFNMLGKEVATLIDKIMSLGQHNVQWNAQGFSSGVYFYQLKTGDIIQTKKMVLLR
ncbi:MAG: hypothetical protein A2455_12005 [Ignavibacteria bacterium RIFOXYC2_FULL_35_16]|nr:MAG: hypothetical protein A2058_15030 [Ignavibacteria bacterium GWA2_36_19]OGU56667.1 MAG: hypothetical protein A2X60_06175 [Ignavibacteria bacterium GWF2_35_20]OGU82249.1 MAG: hypothetical protein A2254_07070 [Ignavibacteria bacterium RIFOXYA2_FULL_35_9]OGU87806.1 MAG: hypothetical protein A2492_12595 [Ignavibacteria bacterium RIFOXYC12_FULL_35_11]OGU90901.1 MAG: hypothetical protein A3K31_08030 [Ignavibacteria bacterium RIFOXYA12_FULL_35_25]OGU96340.1 MAG: hypothetical protein A2347_05230